MGLTPRSRTRAAWALLALCAVAAAFDASVLAERERWNAQIANARTGADLADLADDAPAEARFARANAEAAAGADEAALAHYRVLQGDSPLGRSARYNSANVLMREAVAARAGREPGKAIPLIELAKEMYREVLRADPDHWAARYNLERAQRLLAEPDELDTAPPEAQRNAERAATTMRGYSPGLP